jgi:isocitrate lyase
MGYQPRYGKDFAMRTIEERAIELGKRIESHAVDPERIAHLHTLWGQDRRWQGIVRPYTPEEMLKLRGTLKVEYTFAQAGAERLWHLLQTEDHVAALGALTGNQAVQQVEAGLKAIYLSGWQVAADAS